MPRRNGKPTNPDAQEERSKQATQAEVIERVNALVKMHLEGYSRAEMIESARKKWNIGQDTMDNVYFPKMREQINAQAQAHMASAFEDALEMTRQLYRLAIQQKNLRAAHAAQTEFNKLMGLYKPVKQEVELSGNISGEITDLSHLTFDELYALKHGKKE